MRIFGEQSDFRLLISYYLHCIGFNSPAYPAISRRGIRYQFVLMRFCWVWTTFIHCSFLLRVHRMRDHQYAV